MVKAVRIFYLIRTIVDSQGSRPACVYGRAKGAIRAVGINVDPDSRSCQDLFINAYVSRLAGIAPVPRNVMKGEPACVYGRAKGAIRAAAELKRTINIGPDGRSCQDFLFNAYVSQL